MVWKAVEGSLWRQILNDKTWSAGSKSTLPINREKQESLQRGNAEGFVAQESGLFWRTSRAVCICNPYTAREKYQYEGGVREASPSAAPERSSFIATMKRALTRSTSLDKVSLR